MSGDLPRDTFRRGQMEKYAGCPKCGVPQGEFCIKPSGRFTGEEHAARRSTRAEC
jgi:hypothetical protein